ncbi:MAG: hypothetical protein R6W06_03350, partial [Prochlorococcaceae cyanobacterium]
TRKRIERRLRASGLGRAYIPSFSSRTIVYKGLMVGDALATFYRDLADPDYVTAIAIFHGLISPAWLGERAEDQQRLQLVLALLQRHRGRPTEPVDALLRLLSLHHPEGRSAQLGLDPRLRHLSLALAEQHGLLNPGLAAQLGWTTGQDPIPPLLPLPAAIRP